MSVPVKFNRAAGFRRLGARSHARLLDEQTDTLVSVQAADAMLIDVLRLLEQQHRKLRHAESRIIAANQRASEAVYEAPELSMAVA